MQVKNYVLFVIDTSLFICNVDETSISTYVSVVSLPYLGIKVMILIEQLELDKRVRQTTN